MQSPWLLDIRDANGAIVGQLLDYSLLRLDARQLAAGGTVGTLTVEVPATHRHAGKLLAPGAGLVLRHREAPRIGGWPRVEWSGDAVSTSAGEGRGATVQVVAESDDALLRESVAYPDTTVDVSTSGTTVVSSQAFDVRTGAAETVWLAYVAANIGPTAGIVRRRYPWLAIPASLGRGTTGTRRYRWDDLLTIAQQVLVPSGLTARVVHSYATGGLAVEVWTPTAAPGARYGVRAGNVADASYEATAPRADDVIVGGGGSSTARVLTRRTAAGWGRRRREVFVDESSTQAYAELQEAGAAQLATDSATQRMSGVAVEGASGARFGRDLHLGDVATVTCLGRTVTDVVRRVELEHSSAEQAPQVRITVGWPDPDPEQVTAARVRRDVAAIVRS